MAFMALDDDLGEVCGVLAFICDYYCCTPIYNYFYKCFTGFEPITNQINGNNN